MRKRGQSSVEFTMLISFMFFVFIVFFSVIGSRLAEIRDNNDRLLLNDLGDYIKSEISLAASSEEGYYRQFEIPRLLAGKPYKIEIVNLSALGPDFTELRLSFVNYSLIYSYNAKLPIKTKLSIDQTANTTVLIAKRNNVIYAWSEGVSCTNECSPAGAKECSGLGYHTCGNYDTDYCLEWNTIIIPCNPGEICSPGGNCLLWWNTSWPYREMMYLEDTSQINASGISVKLTLDTASFISRGLMNNQCNDIRFTDSNANFLQHLIETGCNSPSTIIWLKMNITSNSNNIIYMYYGNSTAANPDAVTAAALTLELSNNQGSGTWTNESFYITNLSDTTQSSGKFVLTCADNSNGNNTFKFCSFNVLPFLSSGNVSSKYIYWNFSNGGDTSHLKNLIYELTVNGNTMVFWDMYGNTSENKTLTSQPAGRVARGNSGNEKQVNLSDFRVNTFTLSDSSTYIEHYFNETSVMNSTGHRYYNYNYPILRFIRNETL